MIRKGMMKHEKSEVREGKRDTASEARFNWGRDNNCGWSERGRERVHEGRGGGGGGGEGRIRHQYVVHVVMVAYAHRPYRKRTLVCLCVRCLALLLAPLRACVCVEACGCGEFISPALSFKFTIFKRRPAVPSFLPPHLPLQLSVFHPSILFFSVSVARSLSLWLASRSIRQCSSSQ